jgi:hypothetical protein
MRYYIFAYNREGQRMLGNLDGQFALGEVRSPERCYAWRKLLEKQVSRKVYFWTLENEYGNFLATKFNPRFQE